MGVNLVKPNTIVDNVRDSKLKLDAFEFHQWRKGLESPESAAPGPHQTPPPPSQSALGKRARVEYENENACDSDGEEVGDEEGAIVLSDSD